MLYCLKKQAFADARIGPAKDIEQGKTAGKITQSMVAENECINLLTGIITISKVRRLL